MTSRTPRRRALRRNDGPRAIARELRQTCGWKRAEALDVLGKKWRKSHGSPRKALTPAAQDAFHAALAGGVSAGTIAPDAARCLLLCLVFGLRIAEAVTVSRGSLTAKGLRVFGKGQKWRTVPLDLDPLGVELARDLPAGPACTPGRAQTLCRRLARETPELAALTPHVLRHTYATNALRRCIDPRRLQEALGHDKIGTTLTYLHSLQER